MKKYLLPLLLMLFIFGLSACSYDDTESPYSEPPADATILSARIMDIQESTLLLANVADDAGSADIYTLNAADIPVIEANQLADASSLQPGMLVDIAYNGLVMESYPMQLGGVSGIYIRDQGDDIAGFYQTVINDLYDADPGLNDGLEVLAFDLSQVVNLTAAEKSALVYLIGNDYGLPTIQGTFDELAGQGYIDKENLYFPTGILFTIIDTPREGGNTFTFDAKKWRSGTGAYFFNDCTATKQNGAWTYTVGSEAIS
jgi:hypothetical protein